MGLILDQMFWSTFLGSPIFGENAKGGEGQVRTLPKALTLLLLNIWLFLCFAKYLLQFNFDILNFFDRPGVAGAVLQTASLLINWLTD